MKDLFNLKGEIAVVTGALGKLGPIWIDTLLEAGAKVFALDHPNAQKSEAFKKLEANYDEQSLQLASSDVTIREAVEGVSQKCLDAFGVPSILVNNAGIVLVADVESTTTDAWRRVMNNSLGHYREAMKDDMDPASVMPSSKICPSLASW